MKTLLTLLLLIPSLSWGEEIKRNFGSWQTIIETDDFTDEIKILVGSWDKEEKSIFYVGFIEPSLYDFIIRIPSDEGCLSIHSETTDVLFRVDKNEVLTLPMIKQEEGNYIVNGGEVIKRRLAYTWLFYPDEIANGEILRIRIDDENIDCKIDLAFDLKHFEKAIKPLRDEMSAYIDLAIIDMKLK